MKKKPDPEQFARIVLWHLSGLRAEMVELQTRVAMLQPPVPDEEIARRQNEVNALAKKTYEEALKVAGLWPPPSNATPD